MTDFSGMARLGTFRVEDNHFIIDIEDEQLAKQEMCIYAFMVDGQPVHIGSSEGMLKQCMASWQHNVSRSLGGEKSPTPADEAASWREYLADGREGVVLARVGTIVKTPMCRVNTFLAEASELIEQHQPPLRRNKHH